MVPGNLQQAKEMMSKFPPAPPGRTIDDPAVKSKRQCHGCHGYLDHYHSAIPAGVDRCTRDHDERCLGGIIGGTDSKGRCWRPCPPGYNYQPTGIDYIEGDDNSEDDSDDIEDDDYLKESNNEVFKSPPGNLLGPEVSQAVTTSSYCTPGVYSSTVVLSGASSLLSHCTTTASSGQTSIPSIRSSAQDLHDVSASLQQLRLQREALEEQERTKEQQHQSAKLVELQRQVQAEQDRIQELKNKKVSKSSQQLRPSNTAELQGQFQGLQNSFQSYYSGPNIKQIRKTKGLRRVVDDQVNTYRETIPSLGRRPTAGQQQFVHPSSTGARHKVQTKPVADPLVEEFNQFRA